MLLDSRRSVTLSVSERQTDREEITIPNKTQKGFRARNTCKTHLHIVGHLCPIPVWAAHREHSTSDLCVCVCGWEKGKLLKFDDWTTMWSVFCCAYTGGTEKLDLQVWGSKTKPWRTPSHDCTDEVYTLNTARSSDRACTSLLYTSKHTRAHAQTGKLEQREMQWRSRGFNVHSVLVTAQVFLITW